MATPSTTIVLYTVFCVFATLAQSQSTSSSCRDVEGATRCANFRGEGYCFQQWSSLNQRCVDGICECNNPNYDRCTCLPKVDGCVVAIDDDDAAATYSFRGGASSGGYKVYSCRDENPSNEVHVIGNYEGNGHTGFRIHNTGTTQLNIQGRGNGNPIILVLNSYEPVNWVLNFSDNDVVISKVVLISYYLDKSDVTYQEGRVQSIERLRDAPRGYGTGSGTVELLNYVNQRFGPVASFTGTYQADRWALTLETGSEVTTIAPDSVSVTCDFEEDTICGYRQADDDEFNWNRRTGYSGLFGPSHASTYRDGYYMLASAGAGNIPSDSRQDTAKARLVSPSYAATSPVQCLRFQYHCAASGTGRRRSRLNIYRKVDDNLGRPLWSRPRCNERQWHFVEIDINSQVGRSYQVVFETVHSGWPYTTMGIDDVTISEGWCSGGVVTVPPTNPRPEQLTCYCNECNNRNKVCVTDGSCFGEKVVVGRRERYSFRCLDQSVLQANPFLCRQSPGRSGYQTTTVCCNNEDYCNFKLITNPQTSTTTVKPTTPAPTDPPYIKPGTCPAPGGSSVGICIEMCSGDADCTGNKKCCSNGCGHVCVSPEVEPIVKDGVCPAGSGSSRTSVVRCMQVCESDQDCPGWKKCCQIGCDVICVDPVPDVPAEPEYEVCWSGNMCNQCDRDWVGSINGLDVCCPQCRQSGLRVIAGNCTCAKDWSPDDDGEDGDNDDSRITDDSWTRRTFLYDDKYNGCHGDQYVKLSGYDIGRYVGVILCSSRRYKIFLSDDLDGVFLNVADSSGHGQDHCEFLGGTEESNNIDNDFWDSPLTRGYYRSRWGQRPRLASIGGGTGSTWTGKFYVRWIECGLTIP